MTLAAIHPNSSSESQPQLNLNCLVLGHDPSRIFPIEIAEGKTVGALKDAIKDKKEHAFQHVDADALLLWKVSIPVDRNVTENLSKLNFVDDESLLPVEELSVSSQTPLLESTSISSCERLLLVSWIIFHPSKTNDIISISRITKPVIPF